MNIVLVGFMGTGKTIVGKRLAQRLNMEYVDVDELIEQREGRKINDIFAKDGEPYFRKVEKKITKQVSEFENVVIAAGGGVVLDDENIRNLKTKGVLICLSAQPEIILERTKRYVHRPLLNVANPRQSISALLNKRAPYYAKADFCLDTSHLTIEEVVEKIIGIIKNRKDDRA